MSEPNPAVIKAVLYALGRIPSSAVRLHLCGASPTATAAAVRHVAAVEEDAAAVPCEQ